MAFIVKEDFLDGQDNRYIYRTGDTYPREGYVPTEERIAELCGNDNARGRAVIEALPEDTEPARKKSKSKGN